MIDLTSLAEHVTSNTIGEPARVALDEHEEGLKLEIMGAIVHRPAMGLSIFKRRGDWIVLIPIAQRFNGESGPARTNTQYCDLIVPENDEYCTIGLLRKVVRQACLEAGVTLVEDVSLETFTHSSRYTFKIRY